MADLSHWDIASTFTIRDAAYLMMGVDPSGPESEKYSERHISERLEAAYAGAISRAIFKFRIEPCLDFDEPEPDNHMPEEAVLRSEELWQGIESCTEHGGDVAFERWLEFGNHSHHGQRFSRCELARWLKENNIKSIYSFDLQSTGTTTERGNMHGLHQGEKPLLTRERNTLLTIIAALCKEAKYDYKTPAKTAGFIRGVMAGMGVDVGETTIEGYLKKIPDALESRAK